MVSVHSKGRRVFEKLRNSAQEWYEWKVTRAKYPEDNASMQININGTLEMFLLWQI